jgi:long-chain fatty acid transport protein
MKRSFVVLLAAAAMLALAAGPVLAGGFRIPEAGAKAMGFGNAFVGMADDPSAVQFNPAGLVQVEGNQIQTGVTSVATQNDYTDLGGTKSSAEDGNFLPPSFYYTNHLGEGQWWIGLGVTAPFGLGTEWDVDSFRYVATETMIEMVKLNPSAAYRVNDQWSVGFGLDYYSVLDASLKNDMSSTLVVLAGGPQMMGTQELSGDGNSFGFNVGALFKATDDLSIGFAYRTGTAMEIDGDVTVALKATGTELQTFSASADVGLPATAALGINYKFSDEWQLNLDLDWTGWSSYDNLEVKDSSGVVQNTLVSEKDYEDVTAVRIGVEYSLSDEWALRGGFLTEPTPVPEETYDPRLPDGDRTGYVVGAGYGSGQWTVDFAYMFVQIDKTTVDSDAIAIVDGSIVNVPPPTFVPSAIQVVDGSYEGDITLVGLSVGYSF